MTENRFGPKASVCVDLLSRPARCLPVLAIVALFIGSALAQVPYTGENLIAIYAGPDIGVELDGPDAVTSYQTEAPDEDVYLAVFLTRPTVTGDFDPISGLIGAEFLITVDGALIEDSYFLPITFPVDAPTANIGSTIVVSYGFSEPLVPDPGSGNGNHIMIGILDCIIPSTSTVVTIKVGPTTDPLRNGPQVSDLSGDPFFCGTSVGGNPSVGYDDVVFTINPTGPAPIGNTQTTWSRVKRVYK